MKTSPIAFKIFIARRVAGLAAVLTFAAALYALSWTACRHIVPSWPGCVIQNSGAATDTWFGRN